MTVECHEGSQETFLFFSKLTDYKPSRPTLATVFCSMSATFQVLQMLLNYFQAIFVTESLLSDVAEVCGLSQTQVSR